VALYEEVVDLARTYMGPAAKKFIDRQIRVHLEIEGSDLTYSDIEELADWCYTSSKILMNDFKAREFSNAIKSIRNGSRA